VREQLRERLDELNAEHQAGRKALANLEAEQADLRDTLLRISGAIQVLEELLHADGPVDAPAARAAPAGNGAAGSAVR
jgi:predicted nuclease with TOPRIM domain